MNPAVRDLPLAITWLAPELARVALPDERLADCGACPMAGRPFHAEVRCCTYHPSLANFLVGRALRRGGVGAGRIEARLLQPEGRGSLGIRAPAAWRQAYERDRDTDFGRNPDWACPYWVPGPLSCSIWADRNAVCRSWHCKHVDGMPGHLLWSAVRAIVDAIERRLARLCADALPAPHASDGPEVWAGYYLRCAEHVDQLVAGALQPLDDDELRGLRQRLVQLAERLDGPLPQVLAPRVDGSRAVGDDQVELIGYSQWNPVTLPRAVFGLLAQMDGERTWTDALRRAIDLDPSVQSGWVELLWRHGVLRGVDPEVDAPWGFEGRDLSPEALAELLGR